MWATIFIIGLILILSSLAESTPLLLMIPVALSGLCLCWISYKMSGFGARTTRTVSRSTPRFVRPINSQNAGDVSPVRQ